MSEPQIRIQEPPVPSTTAQPPNLSNLQTVAEARAELEQRLAQIHQDLQLTQNIGLLFVKRQEDLKNCFDQLQTLEGDSNGSAEGGALSANVRAQLAQLERDFKEGQNGILGLKSMVDAQLPADERAPAVLAPSALPSSALPVQAIMKPRRHKVVVHAAPSINDPAFPVQIQEELLNQVRYWTSQAEMKEKLNQEYDTKINEQERIIDALNKQRRMREEGEERQKEEQWNLELLNQDLKTQNTDLQQQLSKALYECAKIQKSLATAAEQVEQLKDKEEKTSDQLELTKTRHEQDMTIMRKHTAGLQREKSDLLKKMEDLGATLTLQQQKLQRKNTLEVLAATAILEEPTEEKDVESEEQEALMSPMSDKAMSFPTDESAEAKVASLARETSFAHQQSIISELQSTLAKELSEKDEILKMLADREETIETMRLEGNVAVFDHDLQDSAHKSRDQSVQGASGDFGGLGSELGHSKDGSFLDSVSGPPHSASGGLFAELASAKPTKEYESKEVMTEPLESWVQELPVVSTLTSAAAAAAAATATAQAAAAAMETARAEAEVRASEATKEKEAAVEAALKVAAEEREAAVQAALKAAEEKELAAVESALKAASEKEATALEFALKGASAKEIAAVETAIKVAEQERHAAVEAAVQAAVVAKTEEYKKRVEEDVKAALEQYKQSIKEAEATAPSAKANGRALAAIDTGKPENGLTVDSNIDSALVTPTVANLEVAHSEERGMPANLSAEAIALVEASPEERRHTCDMNQIAAELEGTVIPPVPRVPKNVDALRTSDALANERDFRVSFGSAFGGDAETPAQDSASEVISKPITLDGQDSMSSVTTAQEQAQSQINGTMSPGRPVTAPPSNLLARAKATSPMPGQVQNTQVAGAPTTVPAAQNSVVSPTYPRPASIRSISANNSVSPPLRQNAQLQNTGAATISGTTRTAYTFNNSTSQVQLPQSQNTNYHNIIDSSGASIGRRYRPSPNGSMSSMSTDYGHERRRSIGSMNDTTPTDPTMIQLITQTMIGDYMWKYTRRPMASVISEKRHRRFFWVHPYSKTMFWSMTNPGTEGSREQRVKSALITAVFQITDENTNGNQDLPNVSLLVQTTNRNLKLTAPSREKHEMWYQSLAYLLSRPTTPGADIPTDNQTWTEVQATRGVNSDSLLTIRSSERIVRKKGSFNRLQNMFGRSKETSPMGSPVRQQTQSAQNSFVGYTSGGQAREVGGNGTVNGGPILSHASSSLNPSPRSRLGQTHSLRDPQDDEVDEEEDDEEDDGEDDILPEHVRKCCDGKHDVGSLDHQH